MKRKKAVVCMALAAMLAAGSVPAYGAAYDTTPHTFTARVGTTDFRKDDVTQPLDVAVYLKDGYTMLPLRTFMNAALENAQMIWDGEKQQAWVVNGEDVVCFDMRYNTIIRNGESLPVYGEQEVKDGRVFVPLRNWGNILNKMGFEVGENDITWNEQTKTATVKAAEKILNPAGGLEKPVFYGEGEPAEFKLKLTTEYDELENLGKGRFLAQKYAEDNFGLGEKLDSRENRKFLLDVRRGEVSWYMGEEEQKKTAEKSSLQRKEEVVELSDGRHYHIYTYYDGKEQISEEMYLFRKGLSQGLSPVLDAATGKYGYVDKDGNWVIAPAFDRAEPFADGYAIVQNGIVNADGTRDVEWGIIKHPDR